MVWWLLWSPGDDWGGALGIVERGGGEPVRGGDQAGSVCAGLGGVWLFTRKSGTISWPVPFCHHQDSQLMGIRVPTLWRSLQH